MAREGFPTYRRTCPLEPHTHLTIPSDPREAAAAIQDFPIAGLNRVVHLVRTRPKADLQLAVEAVEHIDGWKAELGGPVFMTDGSAGAEGRIADDGTGENLAGKPLDLRFDQDRFAVGCGGRREVGIGALGDSSSAPGLVPTVIAAAGEACCRDRQGNSEPSTLTSDPSFGPTTPHPERVAEPRDHHFSRSFDGVRAVVVMHSSNLRTGSVPP